MSESYYSRHKRDPDFRQKAKCRTAVTRAIRLGLLVREPCSSCGHPPDVINRRSSIEAHHHRGYSDEYALDVEWVCRGCHRMRERGSAADPSILVGSNIKLPETVHETIRRIARHRKCSFSDVMATAAEILIDRLGAEGVTTFSIVRRRACLVNMDQGVEAFSWKGSGLSDGRDRSGTDNASGLALTIERGWIEESERDGAPILTVTGRLMEDVERHLLRGGS